MEHEMYYNFDSVIYRANSLPDFKEKLHIEDCISNYWIGKIKLTKKFQIFSVMIATCWLMILWNFE